MQMLVSSVCLLLDPFDLLHHFSGAEKQTCQIVLCVHDKLWEFWSPSFLSSVTYFSTFASREQSLTIGIEKSLISNFILTDLKDINVRFFCSRFWELVVTRYTDVSLGVFYCASFVPNPVVNSFSRRVVEQDYSVVLQVFKNRMSLYIQATFFRQLFSVLLLFEYNGWHFQLRKGWDPVRFWILQLQDNSIFS